MESPLRIGAIALAAYLVAGCAALGTVGEQSPQGAAPAPLIVDVKQVGMSADASRFVFCAQEDCPRVTVKTPVAASAQLPTIRAVRAVELPAAQAVAPAEARTPPVIVDVPFGFNSAQLHAVDRDRLALAVRKAPANTKFLITGRADYVGRRAAQEQVAAARAATLRRLVAANTSPQALIAEQVEIADPARVPAAEQAHQRRGSVGFRVSPANQPSSGE